MKKTIEDVCRSRAKECAQKLPTQILRQMETAMREGFEAELTGIFIAAGNLSVRLWSQRPSLSGLYLHNLKDERFNVSSAILKAHRLHKLGPPNDHILDGKLTKIMVHPALLAYGTHDADQYGRNQILAKAVVWLDG